MKLGKFYGIGVGPGDPDLITVKGMKILSECRHIFVPKARIKAESIALKIAEKYLSKEAQGGTPHHLDPHASAHCRNG